MVSEVLEKAYYRIEDINNWCQHKLVDGEGRQCAIGAIWNYRPNFTYDTTESESHNVAVLLVHEVAREQYDEDIVSINNCSNWIVAHNRVLSIFRMAIRTAKEQEGVFVEIPKEIETPGLVTADF